VEMPDNLLLLPLNKTANVGSENNKGGQHDA
jgi:hypothetical protein